MKESRTERSILLAGRRVTYTLCRKEVKRINLRVRSDGTVYVSAHPKVPVGEIERFIINNTAFVLNALDRMAESHPAPPSADGDTFRHFDEMLTLRVENGSRSSVSRSGDTVTVTVAPKNSAETLLEKWRAEQCREVVTALCRKWYDSRFKSMGYSFPTLRFRAMKSRWGSCSPAKCAMTFNTRLAGYPLAAADYVVLHEFTHLIHPDHSKAFYSAVEEVMPDWKERKALFRGSSD